MVVGRKKQQTVEGGGVEDTRRKGGRGSLDRSFLGIQDNESLTEEEEEVEMEEEAEGEGV